MAFLCVSQQGEVKNTTILFWKKIHVKNFLQKVEGNLFFPVSFFLRFVCKKLLAVFLHEEPRGGWVG
jgi:hypothetical protein